MMGQVIALSAREAREALGVSEEIWRTYFAKYGRKFGNKYLYLPDELESVIKEAPLIGDERKGK